MATPPDFVALSTLTAAQMNLAGAWVVKRDTIPAGIATYICTSAFNADYTNYKIQITNITTASLAPFLQMQLRTGGTTAATNYSWGGRVNGYAAAGADDYAAATTSWRIGIANTANNSGISIDVFRPFDVAATSYVCQSSSTSSNYTLGGVHTTAASYDQFVLTNSSAVNFSGGTVIVIGYRD